MAAPDIQWDDEVQWDDAPVKPGFGDLQYAEAKREAIRTRRNVPAYLLTGMPIDEQRARIFAEAGKLEPPITGRQAAQGMAILGSAIVPPLLPSAAGPAAGGGLFALGTTKASTPGEAVADTALGAFGGHLMGKGVQFLGRALAPVAEYLTDKGLSYGRKALSGVSSSLARRKPIPAEAVREAFDVGAIRPGSSVEGIARRLQDVADPLSERYAAILKELEASGVTGPNAQNLAAQLATEGAQAEANSIIGTRAAALKDTAKALTGAPGGHMRPPIPPKPTDPMGNLGLMQSELMKRELQADAASQYVKEGPTSLAGAARKELAGKFKDAIEQAVAEQAAKSPAAAAEFQPVKEQLHRVLTGLGAAREGAARYARRSPFGLHEALGLASGIATGNPLEAAGAAGLMSALKERGASTLGSAFYSAGRGLSGFAPEALSPVTTPEGAALAKALADALRRRAELVPALAQDQRTESEAQR